MTTRQQRASELHRSEERSKLVPLLSREYQHNTIAAVESAPYVLVENAFADTFDTIAFMGDQL